MVERSEHHRSIEAATFRILKGCQPLTVGVYALACVRDESTLKRTLQRWAAQMTALFRGVSRARRVWHPAEMHRSLRQPTGGVRCARPPANGWQASGLAGIPEHHCTESILDRYQVPLRPARFFGDAAGCVSIIGLREAVEYAWHRRATECLTVVARRAPGRAGCFRRSLAVAANRRRTNRRRPLGADRNSWWSGCSRCRASALGR